MEQTVLTASGLTMRYHSTLALDNLDLTLPQGNRRSSWPQRQRKDHLYQAGRRSADPHGGRDHHLRQ